MNNPNQKRKAPDNTTFNWAVSIRTCVGRCEAILNSGIFSNKGVDSPLFQSAVTDLLINMNDLAQKASSLGKRIVKSDNVLAVKGASDVTELINSCRNAACHINSPNHELDSENMIIFSFNVVVGRAPAFVVLNGRALGSDFEDDIAIFYGEYRLYVRRNILTTLNELKKVFADELADNWMHRFSKKAH